MARRGYDHTTIRDVSRETGISLAGLYYYFKSKEDLLYQIQHRTFASLLEQQEKLVVAGGDAEERLGRLVAGHLSFFARHANEMKLCAFELQSLRGAAYKDIETLRRSYFKLVAEVVRDLVGKSAPQVDRRVRHHTLFIFGMLNWVFMWFDRRRDGPAQNLAGEMVDLVLPGLRGGGWRRR
jgi:AcrR family transcriptional regulator